MRVLSGLAWFACVSALGVLISGCGGGGGGGSRSVGGTGDIYYFANFAAGPAGGPTGQSEVVTIKSAAGSVLATKTVNAPANLSTVPELQFQGLPN